jgi:hypothetical protein
LVANNDHSGNDGAEHAKILEGQMETAASKEQRREVREQFIGDILWTHASDTNDNTYFDGAFVDESKSGISIMTLKPVHEKCLLQLYCKGRWRGPRRATVQWCKKINPAIYRSGLKIK